MPDFTADVPNATESGHVCVQTRGAYGIKLNLVKSSANSLSQNFHFVAAVSSEACCHIDVQQLMSDISLSECLKLFVDLVPVVK